MARFTSISSLYILNNIGKRNLSKRKYVDY